MLEIKILPPSHAISSNTYLLSCGGECAVIDPSSRCDISDCHGKLKYIILTHAHYDHMLNIDEWAEKTGAPIFVSDRDADALVNSEKNCSRLLTGEEHGYYGVTNTFSDGDTLLLGDEKITVISTPGHTPGSVCLLAGKSIFVGDTIFERGGFGRYDFTGGNFPDLRKSIFKLCELDGNITVYSGHGAKFTIEEYKKYIFR